MLASTVASRSTLATYDSEWSMCSNESQHYWIWNVDSIIHYWLISHTETYFPHIFHHFSFILPHLVQSNSAPDNHSKNRNFHEMAVSWSHLVRDLITILVALFTIKWSWPCGPFCSLWERQRAVGRLLIIFRFNVHLFQGQKLNHTPWACKVGVV